MLYYFNELYLWLVHLFQESNIPISWRYSDSLYLFKHYYIPSLGDPFAQCQRAMNIHVNGNVFTYIIYVAYVFVNCSHHDLSLKAQLPYPKWVSTIKKCNTSYFRSLMSNKCHHSNYECLMVMHFQPWSIFKSFFFAF